MTNKETLFSFELMVEFIRINKTRNLNNSLDELALGVRLLDFPMLLINQPQQQGHAASDHHPDKENQHGELHCDTLEEYPFNKGKSCLFKIDLDSLHTHLLNTPLYALVLDLREELPKLLGSSLISLAKLIDRIRCDVEAHGVSTPSSQGEKKVVDVLNLMGEKIGYVSLGYKLLSLGASLLPHIPADRVLKVGSIAHHGSAETVPVDCEKGKVQSLGSDNKPSHVLCHDIQIDGQPAGVVVSEAEMHAVNSTATQTERAGRIKYRTRVVDHVDYYHSEGNSTAGLFCPPPLFYSSLAENEHEAYESKLNLDMESLRVENLFSGDEISESEIEVSPPRPTNRRRVRHTGVCESLSQETRVAPSALGGTLRQLPLLNALLVELSQLNGQAQQQQQQPLSIHPNLEWIYRSATTEPLNGLENSPQFTSSHKARQSPTTPRFKDRQPRENVATPLCTSVKEVKKSNLDNNLPKVPLKKRLVYGTTKTFNLRLKRINRSDVMKRHECREQTETQKQNKGNKSNNANTMSKHLHRRKVPSRSSTPNGNIETLISSIGFDAAPQEATPTKTKHEQARRISHIDDDSLTGDYGPNPESNPTKPGYDYNGHKSETTEGTQGSGPKPSHSDSMSDSLEAVEYIDDFTSLDRTGGYSVSPDPVDRYSPDPFGSPPDPVLGRTRTSDDLGNLSRSSGSTSTTTSFRSQRKKAAALPVPVKAHSSPQRSLKGTHVIRPRTQASALSVSSDDSDRDGSVVSIRSAHSRNQKARPWAQSGGGGAKVSTLSESLGASRSQSGESKKDSVRGVGGYSADTYLLPADSTSSSLEPHEAKEARDALGSLGLRVKYQHVSELVVNKLPGYTL